MRNSHIPLIAIIFLIANLVSSLSVYAEDQIPFSGIVIATEGQRLEIRTENGNRIWVTTEEPVSESTIGQEIYGFYVTQGDAYLLVEYTFSINQ